MSEWWTYRLSSFLMFSPRTYWRLLELYHKDMWPLQFLALGVGLLLLWLAMYRGAAATRWMFALLALAWLWVGWAFHWQRYAIINWGARYLAVAFAVEALLLLGFGVLPTRSAPRIASSGVRSVGSLFAVLGIVAYPLVPLMIGLPWSRSELFGLMPEPTALATLGLLLASRALHRVWLMVIPMLSLLVGAATLWLVSHPPFG